VEELFAAPREKKSETAPMRVAPGASSAFEQRGEPLKKKSVVPVAMLLVFIGMIVGLAVVYLSGSGDEQKLPPSPPPVVQPEPKTEPPPPVVAPPVESNLEPVVVTGDKALVIEQLNAALTNEDAVKAGKLLSKLAQSDEKTGKVQEFSKKVNALRQTLTRCKQLESALRAGNMDVAMATELVAVYDARKKRNELANMTKALLTDTNALNSQVSLGIARVCTVLDDHKQTKAALSNYTATVTVRKNLAEYLEAAKMLCAEGDPLRSADLMQRYLANDSDNAVVWFEYAASKCAGGDSEAALEGLQKAVGYGGDEMKMKAQQDERFKPIMDTRRFRRLTSTDK
jgi:thioredoxin-like negative regulator of GroEL